LFTIDTIGHIVICLSQTFTREVVPAESTSV